MLALGALTACLTGCATTDWTGRRIDDVIDKLGTPKDTQTLPDGRRVYTWVNYAVVPEPPVIGERGVTLQGGGGRPWVYIRRFVVDPEGVVLSWSETQEMTPSELARARR